MSHLVQVHVPDIATKQLAFRRNGSRRILTVSSNMLVLFGFEKGDRVVEKSLGPNKGIVVERVVDLFDQGRVKKVYARTYKSRRNNPLETQIEVSSQRLIDESFPAGCTRVHITFEHHRITIRPLMSIAERGRANAEVADPTSVFAALTSGVDLASMREEGFSISAVLEWRPNEKRDKQDLTETGALCALANSGPLHALFNEDVTTAVLDRIAEAMERHPVMMLHASPQCDDLSVVKGKSLKTRDIQTADSTADMILDLLGVIERIAPPVVLLENVPGMIGSAAYEVAALRLRRWGYRQYEHVGDARDFGGYTSRKRAYVTFSLLDAPFVAPEPSTPREKDAWGLVTPHLADCRDVSHSRSLQKGKASGRLRRITPDSRSIPTPLKSQSRMCKDSVVIEPDPDRFLFPDEALLKRFLGLDKVDLSAVSETLASEIIGQSIDRPHHAAVLQAIKDHIDAWRKSRAAA